MTRKSTTLPICLVTLLLSFGATGIFARAQSTASNVMTLSPASADIDLEATETKKVTTFTIDNQYAEPLLMRAELKGIDETTGLIIPTSSLSPELSSAVSLSETEFTIAPKSAYYLTLTVQNDASLPPGGHYATLVLTQEKIGDAEVSVKQAISAGLFISKQEGQIKSLYLDDFKLNRNLFSMPRDARLKVTNTGNVYLTPRASIIVYGDKKAMLAKGIANQTSRRILQGSSFEETIPIKKISSTWLPTRLTVALEYRADGIDASQKVIKSFLYVPPLFVVLSISLLVGVLYSAKRLRQLIIKRKAASKT